MHNIKKLVLYFSKTEIVLWSASVFLIISFFIIFDRNNYLTLVASLVGVTSLILGAKGHPISQVLMIIFSIIYGFISCRFAYYGEMITYLGMTMPMSAFALITWLKNPYNENRSEVAVNRITFFEICILLILASIVTAVFYFILTYFETTNIIPSTISVTTSFIAVYLTARRSPYFALAYAANDIVLIVLWTLASISDTSYISVTICFWVFLVNDIYGFLSWLKMQKRQEASS